MPQKNFRRNARLFALGVLALVFSFPASAHQHIKGPDVHAGEGAAPGPIARPGDDNENTGMGIKVDRPGQTGVPCGEKAATVPASNQLTMGQTVTLTVFATIAHAGHEFLTIVNNSTPQHDTDFTGVPLTSVVYTDQNGNKTTQTLGNYTYHSAYTDAQGMTGAKARVLPGTVDLAKGCASPGCTITITFKVPNVVCTPPSCTLQWTEQMEDGGGAGPYTFYKSCMDVTIAGASATPTPSATPVVTPDPTPVTSPTPTPGGGLNFTPNPHCD